MNQAWRGFWLAGAALAWWAGGCTRRGGPVTPAGPAAVAAVPVVVAAAVSRDVPDDVRTIGSVEPLASVILRPQVAGQLAEVRFEDGQEVAAGDVLMLIDPRPFQAALAQAEADLARSQALADDAVKAAEQMSMAAGKKAISQREAEQFQAASAAAAATVKSNDAAVERARLNLEYCRIDAPITGRTGKAMVKKGTVLEENKTDLVEINQMEPIGVGFAVPERLLAGVRLGQRVVGGGGGGGPGLTMSATIPGADTGAATGILTFVDNKVDMSTGTIRLRGTFANTDRRLWPGQFVNVALTVGQDRGAVVVPQTAVLPGQRGQHVFVVKPDQTVELRPVTVKRSLESEVVLADGVEGGEVVVVEGQLRLAPGTRVDAKTRAEAEARADAQGEAPPKPGAGS